MSASWSDGYVSEVEYVHGYFKETSPNVMRLALAANGFAAPPAGESFRYLELGCGQGTGVNLLAAAHPEGDFHGVDFNPAHVVKARAFARRAGLDNVTFHDRSFSELLAIDLGDFDFIVLHGVWSWVSADARAAITSLAERHLRAGGVMYVSYNALPGWCTRAPLQHLVERHAARGSGPLPERFQGAIGFAQRLLAMRSSSAIHRDLAQYVNTVAQGSPAYAMHELLNERWVALHHDEVAAALAPARLTFATSATFVPFFAALRLPAEAQQLLVELPPALRESTRDYLLDTSFRSDLFLRGAVRPPPPAAVAALRSLHVIGKTPRADFSFKQRVGGAELTLEPETYRPLVEALEGDARTIGSLADLPPLARMPFPELAQAILLLVVTEAASPALDPAGLTARRIRTDRVNRALAEVAADGGGAEYLVSPVTGLALETPRVLQLFVLAMLNGRAPGEFAWSVLKREGFRLLREGAPIGEDATERELKVQASIFVERTWPRFQRLGIALSSSFRHRLFV